jgi:hypothetical protein
MTTAMCSPRHTTHRRAGYRRDIEVERP